MDLESSKFRHWHRDMADAILAAALDPMLWREIPATLAQGWPGAKIPMQGRSTDASKSLVFLHHGFDGDDTWIGITVFRMIQPISTEPLAVTRGTR